MKVLRYMIFFLTATSILSCKLDNADGPDAAVFGGIYDKDTGELVEQEIGTKGESSNLEVIEYGYSIRQPQKWKIKTSGEYRNNLVFSGTYDIILNKGNFIALDTIKAYEFKCGDNRLDFHVTPNIRIKSAKVEKQENKVVATCRLEFANPVETGKINKLGLFAQDDMFPGNYFNKAAAVIDLSSENLGYANRDSYSDRVFTVEMDLTSGGGLNLTPGRRYFFRIGAEPTGLGDGIIALYNYAPVISIDF